METKGRTPSFSARESDDAYHHSRHVRVMKTTGRMPSFSTRESDGDNRTHAIILGTREGDSMRGGHSTPSPQNPKPQNPFPRERVESRRELNNKKILHGYNSLCKRARTRLTSLVGVDSNHLSTLPVQTRRPPSRKPPAPTFNDRYLIIDRKVSPMDPRRRIHFRQIVPARNKSH